MISHVLNELVLRLDFSFKLFKHQFVFFLFLHVTPVLFFSSERIVQLVLSFLQTKFVKILQTLLEFKGQEMFLFVLLTSVFAFLQMNCFILVQ